MTEKKYSDLGGGGGGGGGGVNTMREDALAHKVARASVSMVLVVV